MFLRAQWHRYRCTVYEYDHAAFDGECWRGRHALHSAARVASVNLDARRPREAAARAYVRIIGRGHVRELMILGAPQFIIDFNRKPGVVARILTATQFRGWRYFFFDDMVVKWYIRVERIPPSRRTVLRSLRYAVARRHILRLLQRPSAN